MRLRPLLMVISRDSLLNGWPLVPAPPENGLVQVAETNCPMMAVPPLPVSENWTEETMTFSSRTAPQPVQVVEAAP